MMIEKILIIAFCTLGYCCIFWEGMLLERLGDLAERHFPSWLWKPVGGCYICACMWVGAIIYRLLWGLPKNQHEAVQWLFTLIGAMGVNALISLLQSKESEGD